MGHFGIGRLVLNEPLRHGNDIILHNAGQLHRAGFHSLRPLCLPPQHKNGLAQGRRLLLESAGVRHDHVAAGHEVMHLISRQRIDQVDSWRTPQVRIHRLPDNGTEVNGIDQLYIRVPLGDLPQGQHDVFHRLAVIFPAVTGDQDDLLLVIGQVVQFIGCKLIIFPDSGLQRIDYGVSGDKETVHDGLLHKVVLIIGGRTEIEVRNGGNQLAVHLLREGGIFIIGTKSRLHMTHLHLVVEGGKGSGKGGGGIAVDQDHIGFEGVDGLIHTGDTLACNGGEGLAGRHDIQIPVRLDVKNLQDAVQHLTVLGGDTAKALDLLPGGKLLHQGTHLDGLRPGAENAHHTDLIHLSLPRLSCGYGPASAQSPPAAPR